MPIATFVAIRNPPAQGMDQDDVAKFTSVRLTRKYADAIDGIDLSGTQVGDRLNLSRRDARMLIAEGWASPCEDGRTRGGDLPQSKPPDEQ